MKINTLIETVVDFCKIHLMGKNAIESKGSLILETGYFIIYKLFMVFIKHRII